ncbi:hypothetical protein QBC33DRAFT_550090, partial [Phialemonium atrogriseum]
MEDSPVGWVLPGLAVCSVVLASLFGSSLGSTGSWGEQEEMFICNDVPPGASLPVAWPPGVSAPAGAHVPSNNPMGSSASWIISNSSRRRRMMFRSALRSVKDMVSAPTGVGVSARSNTVH